MDFQWAFEIDIWAGKNLAADGHGLTAAAPVLSVSLFQSQRVDVFLILILWLLFNYQRPQDDPLLNLLKSPSYRVWNLS